MSSLMQSCIFSTPQHSLEEPAGKSGIGNNQFGHLQYVYGAVALAAERQRGWKERSGVTWMGCPGWGVPRTGRCSQTSILQAGATEQHFQTFTAGKGQVRQRDVLSGTHARSPWAVEGGTGSSGCVGPQGQRVTARVRRPGTALGTGLAFGEKIKEQLVELIASLL